MDEAVRSFFLMEAGLFVLGVVLGAVAFGTMAMPLLYALPRSLSLALQGRLRWRVVPRYLVFPVLWGVIFALGAYAVSLYAPDIWEQLYTSPLFYAGLTLAVSLRAFRVIGSKFARRKLREDFADAVRDDFKYADHKQEEEMGEDVYKPIWHLSRGGVRYGPYTFDELRRRAKRGAVYETDLLWRPGVTDWAEASSVLGPIKNGKP